MKTSCVCHNKSNFIAFVDSDFIRNKIEVSCSNIKCLFSCFCTGTISYLLLLLVAYWWWSYCHHSHTAPSHWHSRSGSHCRRTLNHCVICLCLLMKIIKTSCHDKK